MATPLPSNPLSAGLAPMAVDILPGRPQQQEVWVRAALSRLQEPRSAVRVCEWLVEPVAGSGEVALTLVLSSNVSLSFLLGAEDASDLGQVLRPPGD